jgi:hypothetical protein
MIKTKKEFLEKHAYIADKYGDQNKELADDLNTVIEEALEKFKDFFNSEYETFMPIRDKDIANYLNQKP